MSDSDDLARTMKEIAAGRLAAVDLADIEDPMARQAETLRRHAEQAGQQPEALLSIKELAAKLGKSVRTLRRWNKRADAPPRNKRRRKHTYRRGDLQHWFERAKSRRRDPGDSDAGGGGV